MEPDQVASPIPDDDAAAPAAAQAPRRLSADEQKASPEEQELYSRFVAKAFMLVYDKAFLPKAVDMLGGEGDPQEGLARLSAQVTIRVMRLAKEAGQELPGDVLFAAAKEVFEDLAELSRVANVFDYSQDEDALEGAYFRALDHFRMEMEGDGSIDRESAQADLNTLQQMDESGELEGYFRQLAERDGANRAPPAGESEEPGAAPAKTAPKRTGLMPQGAK